jgi:hypothetical protein
MTCLTDHLLVGWIFGLVLGLYFPPPPLMEPRGLRDIAEFLSSLHSIIITAGIHTKFMYMWGNF